MRIIGTFPSVWYCLLLEVVWSWNLLYCSRSVPFLNCGGPSHSSYESFSFTPEALLHRLSMRTRRRCPWHAWRRHFVRKTPWWRHSHCLCCTCPCRSASRPNRTSAVASRLARLKIYQSKLPRSFKIRSISAFWGEKIVRELNETRSRRLRTSRQGDGVARRAYAVGRHEVVRLVGLVGHVADVQIGVDAAGFRAHLRRTKRVKTWTRDGVVPRTTTTVCFPLFWRAVMHGRTGRLACLSCFQPNLAFFYRQKTTQKEQVWEVPSISQRFLR